MEPEDEWEEEEDLNSDIEVNANDAEEPYMPPFENLRQRKSIVKPQS
jgi:hypothetical protein